MRRLRASAALALLPLLAAAPAPARAEACLGTPQQWSRQRDAGAPATIPVRPPDLSRMTNDRVARVFGPLVADRLAKLGVSYTWAGDEAFARAHAGDRPVDQVCGFFDPGKLEVWIALRPDCRGTLVHETGHALDRLLYGSRGGPDGTLEDIGYSRAEGCRESAIGGDWTFYSLLKGEAVHELFRQMLENYSARERSGASKPASARDAARPDPSFGQRCDRLAKKADEEGLASMPAAELLLLRSCARLFRARREHKNLPDKFLTDYSRTNPVEFFAESWELLADSPERLEAVAPTVHGLFQSFIKTGCFPDWKPPPDQSAVTGAARAAPPGP